ncbi:hypothetical protein OWM54_22350 [Myxococcus sp. MISCRS1]|uniref:hypothetical protein n=1 Tax=Myxococcus sp. MISCRS1 TaxID=2996786 RepID=UPI002271562F|nr:hypothetical protein [Myxococcus sp. MISCRS1]MCY0999880.1 hypothetical protein [Myxococcus sp. MISCRS1]
MFITCSTPSGITASGGRGGLPPGREPQVLNAFRHHGERREADRDAWLASIRCSTPSGTTASGGKRTICPKGISDECSTPSGITASGGRSEDASGERHQQVLSAFRHHGERRPRVPTPVPEVPAL